ncbi:MAG TPA: tetratricopeptide repeat protein [Candidatus Saccharimonadales bacterium]
MLAVLLVVGLGFLAWIVANRTEKSLQPLSKALSHRLQKLWLDAQASLRSKQYLRAEKALLTILRFDEKNAAAYNRLGILYAKQKEFKDAIECFEIASSIESNPSSLHNLGLIYYETHSYEKAAQAFENALELEGGLAARYVAYAKVQEKLGKVKRMLEALEQAVEAEPNPQTYKLLADAYERTGEDELAEEIKQKLKQLIMPLNRPKRIHQPRKVVM